MQKTKLMPYCPVTYRWFFKFQFAIKVWVTYEFHFYCRIYWPLRARPALRWRHNGRDSVSNHQLHHCLLNRLFRHRSKKTPKLRVTGLCAGNSSHKWPVTRKMFPFDDVIMGNSSVFVSNWVTTVLHLQSSISFGGDFFLKNHTLFPMLIRFPWRRWLSQPHPWDGSEGPERYQVENCMGRSAEQQQAWPGDLRSYIVLTLKMPWDLSSALLNGIMRFTRNHW